MTARDRWEPQNLSLAQEILGICFKVSYDFVEDRSNSKTLFQKDKDIFKCAEIRCFRVSIIEGPTTTPVYLVTLLCHASQGSKWYAVQLRMSTEGLISSSCSCKSSYTFFYFLRYFF